MTNQKKSVIPEFFCLKLRSKSKKFRAPGQGNLLALFSRCLIEMFSKCAFEVDHPTTLLKSSQTHKAGLTTLKNCFCTIVLLLSLTHTFAKEIYVSPSGRANASGTMSDPLSTIKAAQFMARDFAGKEPVTIYLKEGIYYLDETLEFTHQDSGTEQFPVYYKAFKQGKVIISGGQPLNVKWKNHKNGIKVARVDGQYEIDQLFINGTRREMARYPNSIPDKNVFDRWDLRHSRWSSTKTTEEVSEPEEDADALSAERIARWKDPKGAYLHAMHHSLWGDMHWLITGKEKNGSLTMEGGWQNNRPSSMHEKYRFVENVFEELDAPGEWFYDKKSSNLYYYPEVSDDLDQASVVIVSLRHLVEFNGSKEKPVEYIHLEGLKFTHTARVFMDNKEPLLRSDWTIYRGGAVMLNGSRYCVVKNCEFDQVGGNAIFVNNYNRKIDIRGCYIHDSGANGIAFVGDPATVRSSLFRYGPQNYVDMDLTPGPKGDNYPADCRVYDCLITKTGRDEKQTAPIQISMAFRIQVAHCSIYDVPRAGINVSEGTFGGHVIEYCDVFNTVLETGDHGSFNSWGRDRFWDPNINIVNREVARNPGLPYLDILEPTIIRHNRWRCDHGWDVDLDDGSTYYRIYKNLMLHGGLKLREGYDRVVTNNIIVNNSIHPHVWFKKSRDVIRNNIVFGHYLPVAMERGMALDEKWGRELDHNLFTTSNQDRLKFAMNGTDLNSIVADPLFIAPEQGDFRVRFDSPALSIGFENFNMDNYGVISPHLKAIAKTPKIPKIKIQPDLSEVEPVTLEKVQMWWDARIIMPEGAELSAYGVDFGTKGIALSYVTPNGKTWNAGLRTGDFIIAVDGTKVSGIAQFMMLMEKKEKEQNSVTFTLTRDQDETQVVVNQTN